MHELLSAAPVITSLIVIEGLLSIDNAMVIAAMASGLPEHQRKKALKYGIVGAYAMRGVCLALASWIVSNTWLKLLGAAYLLYLMCAHFFKSKADESNATTTVARSFWGTIAAIEFMDLSLSLDNVAAAVALDSRLWVVVTGVFIGILCLRFLAGLCIALIEKFPVLETCAFLLVGFVGALLVVEVATGAHVSPYVKFGGILGITATCLIYGSLQGQVTQGKILLLELQIKDRESGAVMCGFTAHSRECKWNTSEGPTHTIDIDGYTITVAPERLVVVSD